ncbi:hypothetical protein D3C86_1548130 [compost metagenome]
MNFIKNLLPSKYVIILILALVAGLVFFYQRNEINAEKLKTVQDELNEANKRVETQKTTIELMEKDAKTQADLMKQYQLTVDDIRQKTFEDLLEISNTDYAKEANSDAPALEKVINERTQKMLDAITNVSRQGKK